MTTETIASSNEQIGKPKVVPVPNKYSDPEELKKGDAKYIINYSVKPTQKEIVKEVKTTENYAYNLHLNNAPIVKEENKVQETTTPVPLVRREKPKSELRKQMEELDAQGLNFSRDFKGADMGNMRSGVQLLKEEIEKKKKLEAENEAATIKPEENKTEDVKENITVDNNVIKEEVKKENPTEPVKTVEVISKEDKISDEKIEKDFKDIDIKLSNKLNRNEDPTELFLDLLNAKDNFDKVKDPAKKEYLKQQYEFVKKELRNYQDAASEGKIKIEKADAVKEVINEEVNQEETQEVVKKEGLIGKMKGKIKKGYEKFIGGIKNIFNRKKISKDISEVKVAQEKAVETPVEGVQEKAVETPVKAIKEKAVEVPVEIVKGEITPAEMKELVKEVEKMEIIKDKTVEANINPTKETVIEKPITKTEIDKDSDFMKANRKLREVKYDMKRILDYDYNDLSERDLSDLLDDYKKIKSEYNKLNTEGIYGEENENEVNDWMGRYEKKIEKQHNKENSIGALNKFKSLFKDPKKGLDESGRSSIPFLGKRKIK